jgi:hypothetical protein
MNKFFLSIFLLFCLFGFTTNQKSSVRIGVVKYSGGGDWYSNPTSVPNLVAFCNKELPSTISEAGVVEVGSPDIFNYTMIHLTGHGNVLFSPMEVQNLRTYLLSGGFLHIDDNYGMDIYIRREMKKVFPELQFVELPINHPIYHQAFDFPKGLPKIHEHDGKPAQGFGLIYENRLVCLYTYECDLGDGWEDKEVHGDSQETRLKALRMGANIVQYVCTH